MSKIEETTEYINEGKRLAEKLQRIVDVQNSLDTTVDLVTLHRRFVRESSMMIATNSNEYVEHYIFLFNDLFLITKKKKKGFEFKSKVTLEEARIVNVADTEGKFCFLC
jgi:hypothetical protein